MNRIIDANLNRAGEALRVLEEIARFRFNDKEKAQTLKLIRHNLCNFFDADYTELLKSRNTREDVGVDIENPTEKNFSLDKIFKANFKRLQQALRVLEEYAGIDSKLRYSTYTLEKEMDEKLKMDIKKYLLKDKKLYLVTNSDKYTNDTDFLDTVALAVKSGVDMVQLREKTKPASKIIEYGKIIRQICSEFGALFIVNDRIDIAQIVHADGVHLGQEDISLKTAREILGYEKIIGISTHKPDDAIKAVEGGADYIGVGPVFKTPTKPTKEPVGLEYVRWAAENVEIPFYAIGSIDETSIDKALKSGATRVALIRAIMDSDDINKTVKNLKAKLK